MAKIEEIIIGGLLSFVRDGGDVSGSPVSSTLLPASDNALWLSLGCVLSCQVEKDEMEFEKLCAVAGGGYKKTKKRMTVQDMMRINVGETHDLYWELHQGFNAAIVDATPQVPFLKNDRHIMGWASLQARGDDGLDRLVIVVRAKLSLAEPGEWAAEPLKPVYLLEIEVNALNASLPDNITA
tara:strand:+ start:117 stop:662 length:546 start_codon:yes stop_codon:yes gene_type:complete